MFSSRVELIVPLTPYRYMVADITASCYALHSKAFFLLFIAPTIVAWAKLGDDGDKVVEGSPVLRL
jgi:hypothetical protein